MLLVFNPILRFVLFWGVVTAVLSAASQNLSWIDVAGVIDTLSGVAGPGGLEAVSKKEFAFSLAGLIFTFAVGMALAFTVCHLLPVLWTLKVATRRVFRGVKRNSSPAEVRKNFAANFETIRARLERNRLLGHAWAEFVETLYDTDSEREIRNTVRPQAFFNPGLARERMGGLKLITSVPGYFVGVGLLLTFIGLVIALYKAGGAVSSENAEAMVNEMGDLLRIATFKFATSIAGLGASIVLSVLFRWFAILIEGAFDKFNAALERSLLYESPQSISLEMKRTLQDQLTQLKDITQGQFFNRLGEEIAPKLNTAIAQAMQPVSDQIGSAIGSLTENSRDGVQDLMERFSESLNDGAGTELRELSATLKQLQMSMIETQNGLRGSGEDFARKLSDAADNLNRMVEHAGQSFEKSSGESRNALTAVVENLRQTMERANSELDESLGSAAQGASAKLELAMGGVLEKLETQIGNLGSHSEQTRQQLEASNERSAEMQKAVLEGLEGTVSSISDQLRVSVETAVTSVDQKFKELASSMLSIEDALRGQKVALEGAAAEASKSAEAFGQSANSVRAATTPLTNVGESIALATERLAESVSSTLEALKTAQDDISVLAAGLNETNEKSGVFWENFTSKFEDVDTALGQSVEVLSQATLDHQQRLQQHVQSVDKGLAEAVGKLASTLTQIQESADSIADSLESANDA